MVVAHAFSTTGPWAWVVYVGVGICALGAARMAGMVHKVPEKAGGALIVVGILVAVLAGTLHPEAPDPSTRPDSPGRVTIETPASGSTLDTALADVQIGVTGFELAPLGASGGPRPGVGHLHVTVDGRLQPQMEGTSFPVCVPSGPQDRKSVV